MKTKLILFLEKTLASQEAEMFWIIIYWVIIIIAVVWIVLNCTDIQCVFKSVIIFGFILWIVYHNIRVVQMTRKKIKKNKKNDLKLPLET